MKKEGLYKLAEKKEWQMMLSLSIPVVLSLCVQGLYGIADSIYVSRLGEYALSAVSLATVVQNFCTYFFSGIATGMNAVLSESLGQNNPKRARNALLNGALVQAAFVVLFTLVGVFGTEAIFRFSSKDTEVVLNGVQYLRPILLLIVAGALQVTLERILHSFGYAKEMMVSQLVGTITNIVLDPILIFGLGGFSGFGVAGAAYATIIGQILASMVALAFLKNRFQRILGKKEGSSDFSGAMVGRILYIGLPSSALGIASTISNYVASYILLGIGVSYAAAFAAYTRTQGIMLMPVQGLSSGLLTLAAFFYGQRNEIRLKKGLWSGVLLMGGWNGFCMIVCEVLAYPIMRMFNPSEEMLHAGVMAIRIIAGTYLISGVALAVVSFFQAIGKSYLTIIFSLSRQIFVRIPAMVWLSHMPDPNAIWWSYVISEVVSDALCAIIFLRVYRGLDKEMSVDKGVA